MHKNKYGVCGLGGLFVLGCIWIAGCDNPSTVTTADDASALAVLQEVDSSVFSHIGYDPEGHVLTVIYRAAGDQYIYEGVPPEVYQRFLTADSKGAFFNSEIRTQYPHTRQP